MAYVKLTGDSPSRFRVAGVTFDEDNRVQEVSDELADLLVERRGGFERVDASALEDEEADADDTGPPDDVSETGVGTIETEDVTAEERAPDYDGVETEVVGEDGEPAAEAADQADTEDAADAEAAAEDEYDADAEDEYDAEDEDEYEASAEDETETRDAEDADAEATDAPLNPGEHTIDELETELADGDYSADELDALAAAERDGQDRTGATDAIDAERGE